MAKPLHISVIIPTLNEASRLPLLLSDLHRQTRSPAEILVIDGGSIDGTQKLAGKKPGVKLIQSHRRGVGHQRTLGGQRAKQQWLCYFDADVRISPTFLEQLERQLATTAAGILCPRYEPETHSLRVRWLFATLNWLFRVGAQHYPAGAGCCLIVRRDVFEEIGGFTPHILCDDLDFIYRAGKQAQLQPINLAVTVSDRRFREDGFWSTTLKYAQISWYFVNHQLKKSNALDYQFGKHRD